jgi:serine/threonine protein kinase
VTLDIGQLIEDRFRVVRRISGGGQGDVYEVHDTIEDNAQRALKTLKPGFIPKALERFRNEVGALKTIQSDRVLPFISTNLDTYDPSTEAVPYFVTEFARCGTLADHDYFRSDVSLCLRLLREICLGVRDAHAHKLLHRDIKPTNILLLNNERDVRVADFGLCRLGLDAPEGHSVTSVRELIGPTSFAAPEQTSQPPTCTPRSDIFSLGRLLHYMITGRYDHAPAGEYVPVSVHLGSKVAIPVDDTLIRPLTEFDPKKRPETVEQVIGIVDGLLGNKKAAESPQLRFTKTHKRLIKLLKSYSSGVDFEKILKHMENFVVIDTTSTWARLTGLSALEPSGLKWSEFVERIETGLEQLEQEGLVYFVRGEYMLSPRGEDYGRTAKNLDDRSTE